MRAPHSLTSDEIKITKAESLGTTMHKLQRSITPQCLSQFSHGINNWGEVLPHQKTEIWQALDKMQQKRCAYCEIEIKTDRDYNNAHIEHFRQRSRYPQGTFQWANLFGSCNREDSCGKYKDRLPAYNHLDLIKMDVEDPEHFFMFLADGNAVPVKNLTLQDKNRAEETIRIFNINGSLRQIRETTVKGYLQTAEEFVKMAVEFEEEDWLPLLKKELDTIKTLPFATAIKHVLLPV